MTRKHSHYFKDVSDLKTIDVYRVIDLFDIYPAAIQHAIKKLMAAGQRGAKNKDQDVQEAIDSLRRWQEMRDEDREAEKDDPVDPLNRPPPWLTGSEGANDRSNRWPAGVPQKPAEPTEEDVSNHPLAMRAEEAARLREIVESGRKITDARRQAMNRLLPDGSLARQL